MKRNNITQALKVAELIKGGNAYTKANAYCSLLKQSNALSRIDTHLCNGTKYNNEDEYIKATSKVYQRIDEILKDTNLSYFHQSDPRGASLYVSNNKLTQADYTNGIAIY